MQAVSSSLKNDILNLLNNLEIGRALDLLEYAVKTHSSDPEIHTLLGVAYSQIGNKEQAIIAFTTATKLENSARTHYNLGQVFETAQKYEQAAEEYRTAKKLNPEYKPAFDALRRLESEGKILITKISEKKSNDNIIELSKEEIKHSVLTNKTSLESSTGEARPIASSRNVNCTPKTSQVKLNIASSVGEARPIPKKDQTTQSFDRSNKNMIVGESSTGVVRTIPSATTQQKIKKTSTITHSAKLDPTKKYVHIPVVKNTPDPVLYENKRSEELHSNIKKTKILSIILGLIFGLMFLAGSFYISEFLSKGMMFSKYITWIRPNFIAFVGLLYGILIGFFAAFSENRQKSAMISGLVLGAIIGVLTSIQAQIGFIPALIIIFAFAILSSVVGIIIARMSAYKPAIL
ncbi:MAG: tetratricopeptide repeat protein [Armatimonadota bacterium]